MADRSRIGTSGGRNICIVAAIESGAVATTAGKYFIFDMTTSSAIGQLTRGLSGQQITLTSLLNSPDLETFLSTYSSDAVEATDPKKFEDGESYATGASETVKLWFGLLGGTASGKIQTFYGTCAISDSDITQTYAEDTERNIVLTTQGWNGTAGLTIPEAVWALFTKKDGTTRHLAVNPAEPATAILPATLAVGKASKVEWITSA